MFKRKIYSHIKKSLWKGKIILLYWPRQVGKTTLVKELMSEYVDWQYMTCDDPSVRSSLYNPSLQELKVLLAGKTLLIIDEAQRVENIGITLKLIVDTFPQVQVIATWSSSFELAQSISEPLTGRHITFYLYPLSWWELAEQYWPIERKTLYKQCMITWMYPDIINQKEDQREYLQELVNSYLYKDILQFQRLKKSDTIIKLLQALALQIWSEVSYHELAQTVWLDTSTVEKYIDLLEKSFVIFRLPSLAKNVRNELKKSKKIYFWDCGVRNAIINTFNGLDIRNDVWALRENFWIAERLKYLSYTKQHKQSYFRRTTQQQEIDYIEYSDLHYDAYELKRSGSKNSRISSTFANNYNHTYHLISQENFEESLI
jgi:uncharacterized protein